jgi:NAD(P)-dependent dehydrogenase (short-subunit alcohol dehydrogenase family)
MEIAARGFLVTGGASGLGRACAEALARRGGRVVLVDRDAQAGAVAAASLGSAARFVEGDVTDTAAVQRAVDLARSEFGGLWGALNCAGILAGARVVGRKAPHDLELFVRVVHVNLVGTFNVVRLAAAAMVSNTPNHEGERGVIVNTASIAAWEGQIGQAAYAASKAGVAGMTLPLARDLAEHGIRVVAIAPGAFATPMMAALSAELRSSLESQIPFPSRMGKPAEFAALAMHVLENPMLNGSVIRIDGGLRMGPR